MLRAGSPTKGSPVLGGSSVEKDARMYHFGAGGADVMDGWRRKRVSQVIISALEWEDTSVSEGAGVPAGSGSRLSREEDQEQELHPQICPRSAWSLHGLFCM